MTEDIRTITVKSMFGSNKNITKVEFIEVWMNHVSELWRITDGDTKDVELVNTIQSQIRDLADRDFERTYKRQKKVERVAPKAVL